MSPESLQLKKEFEIQKIASLHYFEYKSDFIFKSEYHDYWKLLYVEDGSAEITFSNKKLSPVILEKGDLFIQSPDEYYSFKAAPGKIAVLFTPKILLFFLIFLTKSFTVRKKKQPYYRTLL